MPGARLTIAANFLAVRHGLAALLAAEPLRGLSDECRGRAEIVLAEALNNIVEHAYAGAAGQIDIALRLDGGALSCQIRDRGRAMPNLALPLGVLRDFGDDLPEGGFGWFLIHALAQGLDYARQDGQNCLRFELATDLGLAAIAG